MPDRVVVDTHALLWWLGAEDRLGARARRAIERSGSVAVSSISFWEIGMLARKGRITLDRPVVQWTHDLIASGEVTDIALTASIAAAAADLDGFHGDPADRLVVATAMALDAPLLTRDRTIAAWASGAKHLRVVWS